MAFFGDADIPGLMADMGVLVLFGQQQTLGILDAPGKDETLRALGAVSTTDYALTYQTTALNPAPKAGDSITVDGINYIVRGSTAEDDGATTQLALKTK